MKAKHILLGIASILFLNIYAQKKESKWTYEDKKKYAERNLDSAALNMEMLKNDLKNVLLT